MSKVYDKLLAKTLNLGVSNTSTLLAGITNGIALNIPNLTLTDNSGLSLNVPVFNNFHQPTLATSSAHTAQAACNLYLEGAVVRGSNCTLNGTYGLYIDNVTSTAATGNSASLYVNGSPAVSSGNTYAIEIGAGQLYNLDSTASTSNSTGSIGTLGGFFSGNSTDASSSTNGGSCTLSGGLSCAKKFYCGTTINAPAQPFYMLFGDGTTSDTIADNASPALLTSMWTGSSSQGSDITQTGGVFTLTTSGIYMITCSIVWTGSLLNKREISFQLNGSNATTAIIGISTVFPNNTNICNQNLSALYKATAGDTVSVFGFQNSTGSLTCFSRANMGFAIHKLS